MKTYDYLLVGGGCANLSLAYHLHLGGLKDKRILIIDTEKKAKNDRTWCFWSDKETLYDAWCEKSWKWLAFRDENGEVCSHLGAYSYRLLRGDVFYRKVWATLQSNPCFEFLQGEVQSVGETPAGACAQVNGQTIHANWVFDSRFRSGTEPGPAPKGYHYLLQHFLGWRIRTAAPQFDPERASMMDFRSPQPGHTRFFYVLPFSEQEALVEFTLFSAALLDKDAYHQALTDYIHNTLGISDFSIIEEEFGVIPMSDLPLPTHPSTHIFRTGTRGGAVKPSTGYAFLNIQEQARQYADSILKQGQPSALPVSGTRFRFYDSLLLHLLTHEGGKTAGIFGKLFRRNAMTRILAFLQEKTHLLQEMRIMVRLPWAPFFRAIGATVRNGRFIRRQPLPFIDISYDQPISSPVPGLDAERVPAGR
ncbi:MAG: lycopene cyclase [Bacteroidetes bacterium]|nr:MAG: lycopene cyclase [Bacteroidota bacterium]